MGSRDHPKWVPKRSRLHCCPTDPLLLPSLPRCLKLSLQVEHTQIDTRTVIPNEVTNGQAQSRALQTQALHASHSDGSPWQVLEEAYKFITAYRTAHVWDFTTGEGGELASAPLPTSLPLFSILDPPNSTKRVQHFSMQGKKNHLWAPKPLPF